MDSLKVPTTRHPVKIQPMDAGSPFIPSDDDDEFGLGFQNTLVRMKFIPFVQRECTRRLCILKFAIRYSIWKCVDLENVTTNWIAYNFPMPGAAFHSCASN